LCFVEPGINITTTTISKKENFGAKIRLPPNLKTKTFETFKLTYNTYLLNSYDFICPIYTGEKGVYARCYFLFTF